VRGICIFVYIGGIVDHRWLSFFSQYASWLVTHYNFYI